MTHEYKRNRISTSSAALNILTREVLGQCAKRHRDRHTEWLKFLRLIDKSTPPDKEIHIICDNYATDKHPRINGWLKCDERFQLTSLRRVPRGGAWSGFFGNLAEQQLRHGIFRSVPELEHAAMSYIDKHNETRARFIGTKSTQDIPERVIRGCQTLNRCQTV